MKKGIEWLKKEIATEMIQLEPNRKERWSDVRYQTLRDVAQKIDQLDEPEVLSQEWIDKNAVHVRGLGDIIESETVENLIVPKQESEVTLNRAFEKVSETYPMTKEEVYRHLEKFVAHGGRVTYGEPEVLSQEWIDENKEARINNLRKRTTDDVVPVDKLENLLVPKQELSVEEDR